jgi:hypothetical protein
VLDILLFGRLKVIKKLLLRDLSGGCDLDYVMGIFRAYELATTSLTRRNSWEKAEFGIKRRDGASYLFVHEGKSVDGSNLLRHERSITLSRASHSAGGNSLGVSLMTVSSEFPY